MELPEPLEAVDVEAEVTLDEGDGAGGVTCGPAGETGDWIWGGYNSDGEWLLGRLVDGHIKVDARGELPLVRDPDAPVGGALPVALRLDCTTDRDGSGGRAVLWTKGVQVADIPVSGDRAASARPGSSQPSTTGPSPSCSTTSSCGTDRRLPIRPRPRSPLSGIALSGAGPLGIDITEGIARVVGSDSGDVEGVDLAAGSSSQLIPVGSLPTHVVAGEGGVAVSRIDASGILGPLVLIRPGWQEIASVATDALGGIAEGEPGTVWALTKAGEVLLVDTATREIIDRVTVAVDDAEHMEPVSGAGSLWVASDSLPVQRVTGPDLAVSATIETGGGIPLAYADGLVWGARPDAVWAIDPSVDQVTPGPSRSRVSRRSSPWTSPTARRGSRPDAPGAWARSCRWTSRPVTCSPSTRSRCPRACASRTTARGSRATRRTSSSGSRGRRRRLGGPLVRRWAAPELRSGRGRFLRQ